MNKNPLWTVQEKGNLISTKILETTNKFVENSIEYSDDIAIILAVTGIMSLVIYKSIDACKPTLNMIDNHLKRPLGDE